MTRRVIPIIMSGGAGTRLWPLSRRSKPKQFLTFGGNNSLFSETLTRCSSSVFDQRPIVVGANEHRFLIAESMRDRDRSGDILLEPIARNSCPAIAAGCFQAIARDPDAIVIVLAADHKIDDVNAFVRSVETALPIAEGGQLVTFGIEPTHPATGYGYIRPGDKISGTSGFSVDAFIEKPDAETAESFIESGYLWNSGNFLFSARAFLKELLRFEPGIHEMVGKAHAGGKNDLDFIRLEEGYFSKSPSISVDYAVMERSENTAVQPVNYGWCDVGTWNSVWQISEKDESGNVIVGDGRVSSGSNNLVHSEDRLTVLHGVDDLIVVDTRDVTLVTKRGCSEEVKDLVNDLKDAGRSEANEALRTYRPWGNFESLDTGQGYQVKRIVVEPGGILSLQHHNHRAEHWVVVSGIAEVTIDEKVQLLYANQSVQVPLGAVHRLSNPGDEPVVLIEVQSGDYLGEDDIVRLEDIYNRDSDEC